MYIFVKIYQICWVVHELYCQKTDSVDPNTHWKKKSLWRISYHWVKSVDKHQLPRNTFLRSICKINSYSRVCACLGCLSVVTILNWTYVHQKLFSCICLWYIVTTFFENFIKIHLVIIENLCLLPWHTNSHKHVKEMLLPFFFFLTGSNNVF